MESRPNETTVLQALAALTMADHLLFLMSIDADLQADRIRNPYSSAPATFDAERLNDIDNVWKLLSVARDALIGTDDNRSLLVEAVKEIAWQDDRSSLTAWAKKRGETSQGSYNVDGWVLELLALDSFGTSPPPPSSPEGHTASTE